MAGVHPGLDPFDVGDAVGEVHGEIHGEGEDGDIEEDAHADVAADGDPAVSPEPPAGEGDDGVEENAGGMVAK